MSMYEKEWECCGDVTITKSWQPEKCPFCTAPPSKPWVSLTDDDLAECFVRKGRGLDKNAKFARLIEAALRSKNNG